MNPYIQRLMSLKSDDKGSFTIEASMLFPILLILTFLLLLASLLIFQKAMIQQRAGLIADRIAYTWNNSDKNPVTGEFKKYTTEDGDGLYWRLFQNGFLSKFGLDVFGGGDVTANIGESGAGLPGKKLGHASSSMLPPGASGTIRYENSIAGGNIYVELKSPLHLPKMAKDIFGIDTVDAQAKVPINDPMEFIRTTDLLVTYYKELMNGGAPLKKYLKIKKVK